VPGEGAGQGVPGEGDFVDETLISKNVIALADSSMF
nr:hypothetical protein [Tanacetum cinerariifolium]